MSNYTLFESAKRKSFLFLEIFTKY